MTPGTTLQAALDESEARLDMTLKACGLGIWNWDVAADFIEWDDYIHPLFGLETGTFSGLYEDFLALVHADDRERIDGQVTASMATGMLYDTEFHTVWPDGTKHCLATRAWMDRDDAGRPKRMTGVCWDVTERKAMEEHLRRSQRLEGIGTLASGLAHDFNNILAPILMSVPLLEKALVGTKIEPIVATIEQCAERGAGIVRQMLTFARGVESARGAVQVSHLLRDVEKIASETFPRAIAIRNRAPENLWVVNGDSTQFHQVLLNLCVNARDAMLHGGTLTMDAENLRIDEAYAAMSPEAKPGPYLVISISDTGEGIPADVLAKIFDPFFTTKAVGKGTGLGLSTVAGIVRSHGGFIAVESTPGAGSNFRVHLPADPEAIEMRATAGIRQGPMGNGETILVVDDESCIRAIAQTVLQAQGYQVLLAADGTEALAAVAIHSGGIAAVVTDLMMPLMDGIALIRALRAISPNLPIVASTGLGEKAQFAALREMGVETILSKPYGADTLRRAVHAALQPAGAPAER